jgi:dTMP kinase
MNQQHLPLNRGLFITFEGGEGGGKSTVLEALYLLLKNEGYSVIKTREPGGVSLSEKIRHILLEKEECTIDKRAELLLFLAARAQHVHEKILPYLEKGHIVLCDRFNDSSIAYQGIARGLGEEEVRKVANFASNGLQPDCTLLFDLSPKIGLSRTLNVGGFDRIENEEISFHEKVRSAYLLLAQKEPNRIFVLDASLEKEAVFNRALDIVRMKVETISTKTC